METGGRANFPISIYLSGVAATHPRYDEYDVSGGLMFRSGRKAGRNILKNKKVFTAENSFLNRQMCQFQESIRMTNLHIFYLLKTLENFPSFTSALIPVIEGIMCLDWGERGEQKREVLHWD